MLKRLRKMHCSPTLRFLLTKVPGITDETRRCIEDLDAGVKVAWHFLGDRARRRVYDRALRSGKIGPICPQDNQANYTDVRRKLARREFEEAFELLTTKPLTASTFALRGWCGWQLSKLELESELDLAARLDEQNRDVIEYNLRLAIDKQSASLILRWADRAAVTSPSSAAAILSNLQYGSRQRVDTALFVNVRVRGNPRRETLTRSLDSARCIDASMV